MSRYFESDLLREEASKMHSPEQKKAVKQNAHKFEKGIVAKGIKKTPKETALYKEKRKRKQEKKKRIIIRNLSFKVDEAELQNILSKFGNVVEVIIPKKPDGKKRGFAFVQFEKFHSTVLAIKNLNYKKLHGRPIAIDYALPKDKYEHVVSSKISTNVSCLDDSDTTHQESDHEMSTENSVLLNSEKLNAKQTSNCDPKVSKILKELEFDESDNESIKDENTDIEENDNNSDSPSYTHDNKEDDSGKPNQHKHLSPATELTVAKNHANTTHASYNDAKEGKTVFIRNISFDTTQESLRSAVEKYGPTKYCLLCIDRITNLSKGTAFVKFENKDDAEKLISESTDPMNGSVYLDGRKLHCILAVSRDELHKKDIETNTKKKDKRNLFLLREGFIMPNSEESKDVSPADMAKRAKLEILKKQKLKNFNYFVSDTRLCVHNIPFNYTDLQLRNLFKNVSSSNAVITEARIMKDFKKVNSKGEPKSKGFGFVSFANHKDAMQALHKLNNNPSVFTAQKRPIVEFSIENRLALLSKEKRKERNKLKRKSEEAKQSSNSLNNHDISESSNKRQKKTKRKSEEAKQSSNSLNNHDISESSNKRQKKTKVKSHNNRKMYQKKSVKKKHSI